jgi:hypothetical protein
MQVCPSCVQLAGVRVPLFIVPSKEEGAVALFFFSSCKQWKKFPMTVMSVPWFTSVQQEPYTPSSLFYRVGRI